MASMTCRHFHEELERWMDGERSAGAQAHIRSCQACTGLIADLKAIEVEAHSWSAPLVEPPERVWVSLRNQLEAEGIIKTAPAEVVASAPAAGRFSRLFPSVARPILAGAYLAALVAFVTAGVATTHRAPVLRAQLINTDRFPTAPIVSSPGSSNPAVSDLNRSLVIVDNQIAMCEKSVNEEPDNEVAKDFLANAYQQKAELISEISERGALGQ
jgi:hypothetical protein